MPFYALKRYNKPIKDRRRQANGEPLRRSWHQEFLSLNATNSRSDPQLFQDLKDCMHEGQISVITMGLDQRSWYVVAFVDTYYHGDNSTEGVAHLAQQVERTIEGDSRILLDPIVLSQLNADTPIWKPREYFLRVLECRMNQVRQEWQDVVECILQRTEPYVSNSGEKLDSTGT